MIGQINNSEVYFEYLVPEYFIQGATSIPVIRTISKSLQKDIFIEKYKKISTIEEFNENINEIIFGETFFDIEFTHLKNVDDNLILSEQLILIYLKQNFIHNMKIIFVYQSTYGGTHYGLRIDSKIYFDHNNNQYFDRPSLLVHENYNFKVGTNTALYFKYNVWLFENPHKFSVLKLVNIESAFIFADVIPSSLLLLHNETLYLLNREKIFYSIDAFIFESYTNTDKSLLHTMRFTQNEIEIIKMILY